MRRTLALALPLTGLLAALAACAEAAAPEATKLVYSGVQTQLLEGDLVSFGVGVWGAGADEAAAVAYATCAAAQYALIRGYGFARHLRTNVSETGGVWRADAVYTISPALPRGLRTIDAEVTVADCADQGIPTV